MPDVSVLSLGVRQLVSSPSPLQSLFRTLDTDVTDRIQAPLLPDCTEFVSTRVEMLPYIYQEQTRVVLFLSSFWCFTIVSYIGYFYDRTFSVAVLLGSALILCYFICLFLNLSVFVIF